MELPAILTLVTIGAVLAVLALDLAAPAAVMFSALAFLLITKVLTIQQVAAGFSNQGVLTVAAFFVITGALQSAGGLQFFVESILGPGRPYRLALARLIVPTTLISALVNNTSVIATFAPVLRKWAVKNKLAPSKFLIPLSFAALFGGTCTLIGSTANIVALGMVKAAGLQPLGFFEIGFAAIPLALIGCVYLVLFADRLLPLRQDPLARAVSGDFRDYAVEAVVQANCPLVGLTIKKAKLRHLSGLYLAKIERAEKIIQSITPDEKLQAQDRLIFFGMVHQITELQEIPGLKIQSESHYKPKEEATEGDILVEAVVSNSSPVLHQTIREVNFRSLYNAVVLAVHRNGQRIESKIGDVRIESGDVLLLDTDENSMRNFAQSRDFYLVSKLDGKRKIEPVKTAITVAVIAVIVIATCINESLLLPLAFAAIPILFLTRCLTQTSALISIDWGIIVTISSALGLGKALEVTGAAKIIAAAVVSFCQGFGPMGLLAGIYFLTMVLTAIMSNAATVALIFPIAHATALAMNLDPRPFIIAITLAAAADFCSPVGTQCNILVYGPGGYKFTDFMRIGIPLSFVIGIASILLISQIWPLR